MEHRAELEAQEVTVLETLQGKTMSDLHYVSGRQRERVRDLWKCGLCNTQITANENLCRCLTATLTRI